MNARNKCRVDGCKVLLTWQLMCGPHYRMIPVAIKRKLQDVKAVFGYYTQQVIAEAVAAVLAKEHRPKMKAVRKAA